MALCHEKKKFLYEARPDIFPEGYLTYLEQQLWDLYYMEIKERRDNGGS